MVYSETSFFRDLREREFARLDANGVAYLDYTASALYGSSQARHYAKRLEQGIFGNPHSENTPSRASERALSDARSATLAFFDADEDVYEVCFTANTTAAIKLVAESYPFGPHAHLVLSADNHNSVNGVREFARTAGAQVSVLPITSELKLDDPIARIFDFARDNAKGLLAFPVQSNFSGVRHNLDIIGTAQRCGIDVLIDASAVGPTPSLSLRDHPADFLALSFYKLFGLPTGVGALVAKRSALSRLCRPWFSGGTIDFASVQLDRHKLRSGHSGFEDGTPNFLDAGAVQTGFEFLSSIPTESMKSHLSHMTTYFLGHLAKLSHSSGEPLIKVYGPKGHKNCGATIAFNVLGLDGLPISCNQIEVASNDAGVALRAGCFCNPGASERAFGFPYNSIERCLDALQSDFSIEKLQDCLGAEIPVGCLRASFGIPTHFGDIDRLLEILSSFSGVPGHTVSSRHSAFT